MLLQVVVSAGFMLLTLTKSNPRLGQRLTDRQRERRGEMRMKTDKWRERGHVPNEKTGGEMESVKRCRNEGFACGQVQHVHNIKFNYPPFTLLMVPQFYCKVIVL